VRIAPPIAPVAPLRLAALSPLLIVAQGDHALHIVGREQGLDVRALEVGAVEVARAWINGNLLAAEGRGPDADVVGEAGR